MMTWPHVHADVDAYGDDDDDADDVDGDDGQVDDGEGGQVNEEVDVFGDLICTSSDLKFGKPKLGLASVEALHCVYDGYYGYWCCGCCGVRQLICPPAHLLI